MCAETTVTVVVISHEMQSEPVLVADDGRRDITARQPEEDKVEGTRVRDGTHPNAQIHNLTKPLYRLML